MENDKIKLKEYIGKVVCIRTTDGLEYIGKVVELDGPDETDSHEVEIGINFAGGILMLPQSVIEMITLPES